MIIWLTGRPCSGKTTLAHSVYAQLTMRGWDAHILDGDEIRMNLWPELTFTPIDRTKNVLRVAKLANLLTQHHVTPIVSVVSPDRLIRDEVRRGSNGFIEVHVNAPYSVCATRDVKGMYAKASRGEILNFTGTLGGPAYEPPIDPEVECHTDVETIEDSTRKIILSIIEYKLRNRTA